jgi:hypothetical protein
MAPGPNKTTSNILALQLLPDRSKPKNPDSVRKHKHAKTSTFIVHKTMWSTIPLSANLVGLYDYPRGGQTTNSLSS